MSRRDYQTSTVDGARAHAERHAEPDYDDDRPTKAGCDREEAQERWREEHMGKIIGDLEDIESRLEEADEPEAAERVDELISSLSKHS